MIGYSGEKLVRLFKNSDMINVDVGNDIIFY